MGLPWLATARLCVTLLLGELTDGRQQCVHLGERVAEHAMEGNATQEGNG